MENGRRGSQDPDEPKKRASTRTLPQPLPGLAVTIGRSRLVRTNSLEGKEAALQYFAAATAAAAAAAASHSHLNPHYHGPSISPAHQSPASTPSSTPSPIPASVSAPGPATTTTALSRAEITTSSSANGLPNAPTGTHIISPKVSAGSQLFRLLQSQSREERWTIWIQRIESGIELVDMKQLKREIRKYGIPAQYRGQVWLFTSGAKARLAHNQSVYKDLVKMDPKLSPCTPLIEKDLKRSLPEAMSSDDVVSALRRVLIAYSHYNPEIGYCQSMNFIAAILLLFMNEEEAFWLLSVIVEHFMTNYLSETMLGVLADARVFKELLAQRSPKLFAHLEKLAVVPDPFVCKWFLSLFINCMPFECTLRFLDSYLLEGYKILLRVTLALFRLAEKRFLACNDFEPAYMLVSVLPSKAPAANVLFQHAFDRLFVGSLPASKLNKLKESHMNNLYEEKKELIERAQVRCENRRLEYERLLASVSQSPDTSSPNTPSTPSSVDSGGIRGRSRDVVSSNFMQGSGGNSPMFSVSTPPPIRIPAEYSGNLVETSSQLSPRGMWSPRCSSPRVSRNLKESNTSGSKMQRSPNLSPQRLLPVPATPTSSSLPPATTLLASSLNNESTLESQIDPSFRSRFRPLSFLVKGVVVSDDAFDLAVSPRSGCTRDTIAIDQSS